MDAYSSLQVHLLLSEAPSSVRNRVAAPHTHTPSTHVLSFYTQVPADRLQVHGFCSCQLPGCGPRRSLTYQSAVTGNCDKNRAESPCSNTRKQRKQTWIVTDMEQA